MSACLTSSCSAPERYLICYLDGLLRHVMAKHLTAAKCAAACVHPAGYCDRNNLLGAPQCSAVRCTPGGFIAKRLSLQEKLKLAREVEDLNNTVFSKSFKAPSAWAEREVKYKMEKRDWDAESKKLRETITKLEAENARYRAENKAEEFEAQIQVPSIHQRTISNVRDMCSPSFSKDGP